MKRILYTMAAFLAPLLGLNSVQAQSGMNCDNCDSGSGSYCDAFDPCGSVAGPNVLVEALFLRPYNTDLDSDSDADTNEYKAALRLTLGYTGRDGLGGRVRWLDYDVNTIDQNFQVQTLDSELYSNIRLCNRWFAVASGGIRYAEVKEDEGEGSLEQGYGPLLGLEIHHLWSDRITLYGIGRAGILVGKDDEDDNVTSSFSELQIGSQYQRYLRNGTLAFLRAGIEAQRYNGYADEDAEDLGLFGSVFSIGINR